MQPTCRILAMDGGGIRGILPARVLAEIERRASRSIADTFNLLAGTSTGGLLALGLAIPTPGKAKPYSAEQMLELYRVKGPTIFASSLWHSVASLGAITDTRYDSDNIENVLEDLLKDRLLSDCLNEIDVLVPAYEIEQREAYFFKSWHAKGEPEDHRKKPAQRNFLARDVARATSAAPTYFEPARVKNRAGEPFSFIDGGVFANNPAMSAVVAARWLYPQAQRFCILSLGTGTMERPIPYNQAKHWAACRLGAAGDQRDDGRQFGDGRLSAAGNCRGVRGRGALPPLRHRFGRGPQRAPRRQRRLRRCEPFEHPRALR
jgi:patatin-like phospholipase/acyl hydrolase